MSLPEVNENPCGLSSCPGHISIELRVITRCYKRKDPTCVPSFSYVLHCLHI